MGEMGGPRRWVARLAEQDRRGAFVASRLLWATGACRLFTMTTPHGARLRFYPSSVSAALWLDPAFRREDGDFVQAALAPGETFVDVGANVGQLTLAGALRVGPEGDVVAVEPHPRVFRYLRGNLRLNRIHRVEAHNVAVGDRAGEVVLTDLRSDDQNGVAADVPHRGHRVRLLKLDRLLEAKGTIALLKIDVEGYEPFVLAGATKALERTRALYIEDAPANLSRYGRSRDELRRLLSESGFEIHHWNGARLAPGPGAGENIIALRREDIPALNARLTPAEVVA